MYTSFSAFFEEMNGAVSNTKPIRYLSRKRNIVVLLTISLVHNTIQTVYTVQHLNP